MKPTLECHCGKDGHALNSINCPVHGYTITSTHRASWPMLENEIAEMTPESEPKRFTFTNPFFFRGADYPAGDYILRQVRRDDEIAMEIRRVR